MRARHFLLAAALAVVTAATAFAADVAGTWTAEFDTQIGVQKYVFTFKVDGEKLTGTADAERMGQKQAPVTLEAGTVKGDQIAFVETLSFEGNTLAVTYTGTVAGDEIKFSRNVGDFATEAFVAKRKKD
jgi:opacity protein-like surface antigen